MGMGLCPTRASRVRRSPASNISESSEQKAKNPGECKKDPRIS